MWICHHKRVWEQAGSFVLSRVSENRTSSSPAMSPVLCFPLLITLGRRKERTQDVPSHGESRFKGENPGYRAQRMHCNKITLKPTTYPSVRNPPAFIGSPGMRPQSTSEPSDFLQECTLQSHGPFKGNQVLPLITLWWLPTTTLLLFMAVQY